MKIEGVALRRNERVVLHIAYRLVVIGIFDRLVSVGFAPYIG